MSDLGANNYLFADAVRIELLPTPPAVQIIDNGDTGFATPDGVWLGQSGKGHDADIVYNSTPNGGALETATWTFTGLAVGSYRVSATWQGQGNLATNASYTILDGANQVGAVSINQAAGPDDFSDAGSTWEDLGGLYTINGGTLVVQLSDLGANNYVFADAVRIELQALAPISAVIVDSHQDLPVSEAKPVGQSQGSLGLVYEADEEQWDQTNQAASSDSKQADATIKSSVESSESSVEELFGDRGLLDLLYQV